MKEMDLLIIYNDGTEKVIKRVTSYFFDTEIGCFKYSKNGYYSFIPYEAVRFLGREFDYREN